MVWPVWTGTATPDRAGTVFNAPIEYGEGILGVSRKIRMSLLKMQDESRLKHFYDPKMIYGRPSPHLSNAVG